MLIKETLATLPEIQDLAELAIGEQVIGSLDHVQLVTNLSSSSSTTSALGDGRMVVTSKKVVWASLQNWESGFQQWKFAFTDVALQGIATRLSEEFQLPCVYVQLQDSGEEQEDGTEIFPMQLRFSVEDSEQLSALYSWLQQGLELNPDEGMESNEEEQNSEDGSN